jgi:hypothetical protein
MFSPYTKHLPQMGWEVYVNKKSFTSWNVFQFVTLVNVVKKIIRLIWRQNYLENSIVHEIRILYYTYIYILIFRYEYIDIFCPFSKTGNGCTYNTIIFVMKSSKLNLLPCISHKILT